MTLSQDTSAASGNLQLTLFPHETQQKCVSLRYHYCEEHSQHSQHELLNTRSALQSAVIIRNMAFPFHWFPLLADKGSCSLNNFLFSAGPEFHCDPLYLYRYSQELSFALALVVHSKRSFGKTSSSASEKGSLQSNKPRHWQKLSKGQP